MSEVEILLFHADTQIFASFQAAPWQRVRHWFAPPAHALLAVALAVRNAAGGWRAEFGVALPMAATAYLCDHQVCLIY